MTKLITVLVNREDNDDKNCGYNDSESNILITIVQDGNGKNSNVVK